MSRLHYFAYGSNMSLPRIRSRTLSAHPLGIARLPAHRLAFHKVGGDGSGKCDAFPSCEPDDVVIGVLFRISHNDRRQLDHFEGAGRGYETREVMLELGTGKSINAFTYIALQTGSGLRPYHWYKEHVLYGARQHSLPGDYVRRIERIASVADPDPLRHAREMQIYCNGTRAGREP